MAEFSEAFPYVTALVCRERGRGRGPYMKKINLTLETCNEAQMKGNETK